MKKLVLFILIASTSYADNQNYFDNAYQMGKQNQYNLNLNQNSTFNSYTQANNIESNISKNATTGTIGAETTYKNADKDANYLYNQGKQEIANCQSKSDPRCTTLNKYGDKDTQTSIQAYRQGISEKYYIAVRPDPSDTQCSYVTRKLPINSTEYFCNAALKDNTECNNTITPSYLAKCTSSQKITDRKQRPSDPTGHCDFINVILSCNANGNYNVMLATEDCTHTGYSSTANTSFSPTTQQQTGNLLLTPTWTGGNDGCPGQSINLAFKYSCPANGECTINFNASCNGGASIYNNSFYFTQLTTKEYKYTYNKGCANVN